MLWRAHGGENLVTNYDQIWQLSVPHTGTLSKKTMEVLAGYDSSSSTEEDKIQRKLTSKEVRNAK